MSDLSSKKIVIFRHGERVDFIFGNDWHTKCFENGKYVRKDLNLPESIQERDIEDWKNDCPLTIIGMYQAKLTGSSLKSNGFQFDHVISSPSYRCVQTCHGILQEMGCDSTIPMKIEPGLFDWFTWSNGHWPIWCCNEELKTHFNIDMDYKSVMSREQLTSCHNENLEEYYNRNYRTMKKLLEQYDGNILIVAHATSLDACTRQLVGRDPRTENDLYSIIVHIPYLSAVAIKKLDNSDLYQLMEPPCMSLTYYYYQNDVWKILDG